MAVSDRLHLNEVNQAGVVVNICALPKVVEGRRIIDPILRDHLKDDCKVSVRLLSMELIADHNMQS